MQQGVELSPYLTTFQSIPATFLTPHYPLLSTKLDHSMPVLPERSKPEPNSYWKLEFFLITKAHATGGGVITIFDYMPKHFSYIHDTPVSIPINKIGHFHASITRKK